jgi:hypothetical protein
MENNCKLQSNSVDSDSVRLRYMTGLLYQSRYEIPEIRYAEKYESSCNENE